jgi:uncharacterized protein
MFPLGGVLFPHSVLPLRIFEMRYLELLRTCLDGAPEPEFGVVLIERGSEIGGGDTRFDVGCVARILDVEQGYTNVMHVVTVGVRRIRVATWLDDDPYPRAEVDDWPDPQPGSRAGDLAGALEPRLRRVMAMASELGLPTGSVTTEFDPDPLTASYQMAASVPVSPLDQLALLASPSVEHRLELLGELVSDAGVVLEARLADG